MKHRKITIIPILSMIFIGFFLTMNINLLAPRSSISKTLNSSASGDVWFSSVPTQTVGDTFETNIYVDTGSQILGAYGFEIAYNDAVIQIVNSNDVVAGAQGFVSAVNIDNNNGVVTIAGFDAMGTGPGSQLHLLTLAWTAVGTGTSSLDLSIMDLADNMLEPIGTATDIDGSVVVEIGENAPVLNSPSTVYYQENTIGHSITWIATDDNPTTFIVTRLNVPQEVVASGSWSSGVGITVSIDGLSDGYWVYNCTVYDEDGLFDTSFVNVRVTPTAVGDVWFSSVSKQTIGNTFETKIYINTGSQNLGIYGFQIAYNESVIQIASNDDIVAGPRGFVSSINVDNANGLVTIIGIDAMGTSPMVELHLFTITWTAVGLGNSSLDLTIDALSDIESLDIGTSNAIDGSVEVRDPISAPVLSYPLAFYYLEDTIGHSITWIATDDNPTTYTVTRM
ncbi:MAG: hypothetical protein JXA99_04640, partial [Candidatus Lokiarchaeota archaeon]|nr:hypothetical protein [Candidatus Lokiarchaeota archaeon]